MAHGPPVKPVQTPSRGRPRSAAARARVLAAARALLEAQGPGAVTIEAVAARSGVSKPTIYRTWPNAPAVLMAALMDRPRASPTTRRRSPTVAGLRQQLRGIARTFASRTGRTVTMMLASAEADTELTKAFRHHFILARREEGRQMLAAAVASGELRHDLDIDVALDQLYGPIFFRLLVGHAPADEAFVDRLLAAVVGGLAAPRARR